jgi:ABC-type nitrate/sulfonate/bicarbonate transport system permease component
MPKEVLIMIGVAPIMAVTMVAALDEVPDDLRLCVRTLGASPRYTSIVAAGLIAATSGLGYLISQAGDYLNIAPVFSGILTIAILGLILDACLRGLLLLADPSRGR